MKLLYSPASPFARKVIACAITRGLDGQIERVSVDAGASPEDLVVANPLGKIPTLVTDDGVAIYDSRVICEYLDSLGDAVALFPPAGGARWRALKFQAMGDGIMDAAVLRRGETMRPTEPARDRNMERQHDKIARTLAALERDLPHRALDIGTIAVACALGYLDLRFAQEPWRPAQPQLAAWLDATEAHPCLAQTRPAAA